MPTGTQLLTDLDLAYNAGAQYLLVFNYPEINQYGALTDEHFQALQTFWTQIHSSHRKTPVADSHVALVLPKDYGWGMRQPTDNIWGLWPADDLAPTIGTKIAALIKQYGTNLDIIYDDSSFNYTQKYSTIYYWNGTTIQPKQSIFSTSSPTLYATIAIVALVLVCVPSSYLFIRSKKKN
jgi:hypothetical protein